MTGAAPDPGARGDIRVGIVDDHRMFLDGLTRSLRAANDGLQVTAAVASWVELLRHPAFPLDVVLLDLDLEDGVPARTKIATCRSAGVEVVVVSSYTDAAGVRACLAAGAHGYVAKSEDIDAVVGAVRAAAEGEQYLTPALAAALLAEDAALTPMLSPQELRALTLYASGLPLKTVARQMGVRYETAKSYLDRVRQKYALAGREARTKVELRTRAVEDGLLVEGERRRAI